MVSCPACGSENAPAAKFCGSCGAALLPPVPAPPSGQPCKTCGVLLPATVRFCNQCGTPVKPESLPASFSCASCKAVLLSTDRFCGSCGATVSGPVPVQQSPPVVRCGSCGQDLPSGARFCSRCAAPVPPVPAPARPEPAAALKTEQILCPGCKKPISTSAKFCGSCGTMASVPPSPPAGAAPPPAPQIPRCKSCDAEITGPAKFCGICGTPVETTPAPAPPVTPEPKIPRCGSCGSGISPSAKFCGICGTPSTGTPAEPPVSPAAMPREATTAQENVELAAGLVGRSGAIMAENRAPASPSGETVIGIIPNTRKLKFLGNWDSYTTIITTNRMIFARLTAPMLTEASRLAVEQAKADGKGVFGQWGDQLRATVLYSRRYLSMNPDAIVTENTGNIAVENNNVVEIKLRLKEQQNQQIFLMTVVAINGTFEYAIDESGDTVELLKSVYGSRLHLPFGYVTLPGVSIRPG